ncbi:hypothetical protein MHK_009151 [Candidatus Magnetomorum sp. HK-1]|nr:hypothetical protein MHK_009151 [Candidatus Magnetomorum sp. HK-1]
MTKKIVIIGFFYILVCLAYAQANDKITWLVTNWPPWMILEGNDQGKGRFNHILLEAHKNMNHYQHETLKMNWSRFWADVSEGQHICNIFAYKTPDREKIVYFSEPHTFVLPNAIIMKKENIKKLGHPKSYSIVKLLQDKRFKGIIEKTRSFSQGLDKILEKHKPGSNLTRKAAQPDSFIKMLYDDRIDYTIEYPIVASYLDQKHNPTPNLISSIPIEELPAYNIVHMACPKNEWGKKVIDDWNTVFRKLKRTEEYRKITEMGHIDERELNIIRENYDNFLKIK